MLGLEYLYRNFHQPLGSLASREALLRHGRRHAPMHHASLSIRDFPDSVERLLHQRIQLVSSVAFNLLPYMALYLYFPRLQMWTDTMAAS